MKFPGMSRPGPKIFRDDSLNDASEKAARTGSQPFPTSRGSDAAVIDRSGVGRDPHNKNSIDYGLDARFNRLSPGINIEDQKTADIHAQPYKVFRGYGPDGVCTEEATWKTVSTTKGSSRNRGK